MTLAELQRQLLPKFAANPPVMNIIDAANAVSALIFNRLVLHRSALGKKISETLAFAAGDASKSLPADFLNFAENPRIGSTSLLPVGNTPKTSISGSTPAYYERAGIAVYLLPVPTVPVTLTFDYWRRPAVFASLADPFPLGGGLDQVFSDLVFRAMVGGEVVLNDATASSKVDGVVTAQAMQDEQLLADVINGFV